MIEIVLRHDPVRPTSGNRPEDASQAEARLAEGNEQFARLWTLPSDSLVAGEHKHVIPIDADLWGLAGDKSQVPAHKPFAAVLSCSDARVPPELIFGQALNDLFVVRLAGNVASAEGVGSLAYAALHLGESIRLLVVLGHGACGAVTAAVDAYLDPSNHPEVVPAVGLRQIIDRILIPVRSAAKALDEIGGSAALGEQEYRDRLIRSSIVLNAAHTAMTVNQLLADVISVDLKVVFGVYDLETARVGAVRVDAGVSFESGLVRPPESFEEFEGLAGRLAEVAAT